MVEKQKEDISGGKTLSATPTVEQINSDRITQVNSRLREIRSQIVLSYMLALKRYYYVFTKLGYNRFVGKPTQFLLKSVPGAWQFTVLQHAYLPTRTI